MTIQPNQLIRWDSPFKGAELSSFFNSSGADGVVGLAVRRTDGTSDSACLLVSVEEHTQKTMYSLFQQGRLYEPHTTAIVVGALRPGDTMIDVGAHVGYFSVLSRLCVGPQGSVFAFEPLPETYRRLLKNVIGNRLQNVMALPIAVSDCCGEASFYLDPANEGESSLLDRGGQVRHVVQTSTLDAVFENFLEKRPRVMKLDAEGVELNILHGAAAFFETHAPDLVICEHNGGALSNAGISADELRAFFDCRGYRCGVINNGAYMDMRGANFYRMIGAGEKLQPDDYGYVFNMMFVRDGSGLYPDEMV